MFLLDCRELCGGGEGGSGGFAPQDWVGGGQLALSRHRDQGVDWHDGDVLLRVPLGPAEDAQLTNIFAHLVTGHGRPSKSREDLCDFEFSTWG